MRSLYGIPDYAWEMLVDEAGDLATWPWPEPEPILEPEAVAVIRVARGLGTIPLYGTPQWRALPKGDRRRVAAMFIGAEHAKHRRRLEVIAAQVLDDMAEQDLDIRRRFRQASWDVSAATDWRRMADRPTWAELCERRGETVA